MQRRSLDQYYNNGFQSVEIRADNEQRAIGSNHIICIVSTTLGKLLRFLDNRFKSVVTKCVEPTALLVSRQEYCLLNNSAKPHVTLRLCGELEFTFTVEPQKRGSFRRG
jgi:hypothetical protein